MCGISGWVLPEGSPYGEADLRAMADSLAHRGPDDFGLYRDPPAGVALAHNRLSIIDLSPRGHQPMLSPEGDAVLCYNGELYNFRELRETLEAAGYRFRSASDTEVVLHAFRAWGDAALDRFQGMFALALWQPARKRLLLARDPLGIKPLYFWQPPGGGLVFASEVKAFLALPGFRPEADPTSLQQFLEFGYTISPGKTSLRGVHKLESGHRLTVSDGCPGKPERYFHPVVARSAQRFDRAALEEELYATLSTVVERHLIADVPVGLLLSGGLDSSLIAALAARHTRVHTLSMAFADSAVDERPYARAVAEHIGAEHEEILIEPGALARDLEHSARNFDDLFGDWGLISTHLLYRAARERGVKVVIVGEGSDELFGGYDKFFFPDRKKPLEPQDLWLYRLYRRYAGRRYGRQFRAFRALMRDYLAQTEGDLVSAVRLFESRSQLPNNYVMKVDKASMAASVEARVPFLDARVAALAYRVPGELLLMGGQTKSLLRSMAKRFGLLPDSMTHRPKYGASIAASWMDDSASFRRYAQEVILARGAWTENLGLRSAMTAYFQHNQYGYRFPRPISIFRNLAWRLLTLELWARAYGVAANDH